MSSVWITSPVPRSIPRQLPKVCSGGNRRGCQSFPQTFQRGGEEVFTAARNDEIRHSVDNLLLVIGISPRHAANTLPNKRIQSGFLRLCLSERKLGIVRPRFLKELEPVRDASLITSKEESPTILGFRSRLLLFREFRAELHTTAQNAILLD